MFLSCCGIDKSTPEQKISQQIDASLAEEKHIYQLTHRLLLLGAGESGKSTIIKQMQIINLKGFCLEERKKYIRDIHCNVYDAIVSLLSAMPSLDSIRFQNVEHEEMAKRVFDKSTHQNDESVFSQCFFDDVQTLWQTEALQKCYQIITIERSYQFNIIDSAKYFLDKASELSDPNYLPSDQDILRCRVLTNQIIQINFKVKDAFFSMFDVGGQRDQRRKWIQCFNNATAIVFVAALSSYNMALREDITINRLQESLDLFRQVWVNRFLSEVSVVLFLNKYDLLLEKVESGNFNLGEYFPAYKLYKPIALSKKDILDEPAEFTKAKFFIRDSFLSLTSSNMERGKMCFPHFTCAVDTNHMRKIFEDCRIIIQRIHLDRFGISLE